jgi:UDP-3-O-[3-hydroxymyristoyl] N-acetylglucosamine deacetylase
MPSKQKTIKNKVKFIGKGIHTGQVSSVIICPSPADSGIYFRRTDLKLNSNKAIKALHANVSSTYYCTELSNDEQISILTVEHLLAALFGLNIDNAEILIDGPEVPILDGSSKIFLDGLKDTGTIEQNKTKKFINITKPIRVSNNSSYASFMPYDSLFIDAQIDFSHECIGVQRMETLMDHDVFQSQIASSRTFGFLEHAEKLKSMGYGLGVNLSNTIVLTEKHIMNGDGLQYNDEFVRHKILDICGDLKLANFDIIGKYTSVYGGHHLNFLALQKLFENIDCWELTELDDEDKNTSNTKENIQQKLVNL